MISKKFLVGILAVACAASAQAGQISLSASVAPVGQLSKGQSQNLQVNVNGLLSEHGLSSQSILSGILTVTGFSAPNYTYDDPSSSGYVQAAPRPRDYTECSKGVCTTTSVMDKVRIKDITAEYNDSVADIMKVMVGEASAIDTADTIKETYSDFSHEVLDEDKTTGNAKTGFNLFYHRDREHSRSISGGLEVMLGLDDFALDDLLLDGILNLSVKAADGQFQLTGLRLDFIAQEAAAPAADAQIPVPTSLLLTGLGLAALGTMRRRRKA